MNAQEFLALLQKSEQLSPEDFKDVLSLQEDFPYFLIPKVLGAKYEWERSSGTSNALLHAAAVLSPNRKRLKGLLTGSISLPQVRFPDLSSVEVAEEKKENNPAEKESSTTPDQPEAAAIPETPEPSSSRPNRDEILRRLEENLKKIKKNDTSGSSDATPEKKKEVNPGANPVSEGSDLIESIAKKEEREISDERKKEQLALINSFQEKPIRLPREQMDAQPDLPDLSEKSTHLNDSMLSESFARLLVKQNKKQEAIEIYRKLILKFPKKKTYFADQIEKLKA
ncbi:hypothetical protein SAMN05192553_104114 [Cyclobacterium xiamenense]|uniref:Tetratricopeptide repeat-containing protein n=1 Tax=Cyclobacterium xiamenense TaxID=1297121 RepID=A0A1H6YZX9_9BACT|nr:hypothetical protein [Cyclobacterium xiamenense]SEJ46751.1 hypothetical protein SAMN05192553_104114 [Cyclobacterium xiamenense]